MGMIDNYTKLATKQVVTATADTASTNVYDSGSAAASDIGLADELWLNCQVGDTAATSGGAATMTPVLQHSDDNVTFTDAMVGPTAALASLTPGAMLWQSKLPVGLKRYLRVAWRVGTAALTAGNFTAFISLDLQRNIARPSGFSVQ